MIGTPYYLAPEVLKDQGYDYKADIWAVGISAIEMAEKDPPYADLHPMRVLFVLANNPSPKLTHEEHWSPEFNAFVNACLELLPEKRPSAHELLSHPFLRKSNPSKLEPLIQLATDAIQKHGGLEKALDAMKPKPEDEAETEQDAVDKDMNEDMLAGSGALLTLDSPASTAGTSLAIGSSDDDEAGDSFFDDFDEDGSEEDEDDLDIDDLLADLGDDEPKQKAQKKPKKSESSSALAPQTEPSKPSRSEPFASKTKGLALDLTGVLGSEKKALAEAAPTSPHKQTSRTPRTRRDEGNKLKIQMGANGQIFGAPAQVIAGRQERAADAPLTSSSDPIFSQKMVAEIDWNGLEEDAQREEQREKQRQGNIASQSISTAADVSSSAVSEPVVEKSSLTIDWSKSMASLQEEVKNAAAKRHLRGTPSAGTSSGNYEDLLAELDVIGKRSSTPERAGRERTVLVARAFEKEFPSSGPPCGMKGDWVGRFDGPNPFRNNPQFVFTVEKPTQVLVTLRLTKSSRPNAPVHTMSIHVFQVRDTAHAFPEMPSYGAVIESERVAERQVSNAGLLEEPSPVAKYVVVPIIHELALNEQCSFELEIKCANPMANPKIGVVKSLETKLARGEWTETTAGGSAAFPTWRQNPQYHMKVHKQTDMHIFLTQHTKIPEHLGCYILRTSSSSSTETPSTAGATSSNASISHVVRLSQSKLLNNDMKFRKKVEIGSGRLQLAPGSYVVIPATYEPGKLMPFTFSFLAQQSSSFDLELIKTPVCRTFNGSWTKDSAGGCMNSPSWIKNPKYSLSVTKPSQITFVLSIATSHHHHHHQHHNNDPLSSGKQEQQQQQQQQQPTASSTQDDPFVGFYLFRSNSGNVARISRKDLEGRTKNFSDAKEVIETVRLDPGAYILLPCTYDPGVQLPFHVQILADSELENVAFIEEVVVQVEGEWKGASAGGNFSHPSWRLNPQYLVTATSECSIVASLEQSPKATAAELPFISLAVIRPGASLNQQIGPPGAASSSSASGQTTRITSKLFHITPKEVVSLSQFSNVLRQVSVPLSISPSKPLLLLPMTMAPNTETTFKLAVNHKDAKIERLTDNLYAKAVQGEWSKANGTAGGCINNRDTWLQNPKFRFATKKPGTLRFIMQQQPAASALASAAASSSHQHGPTAAPIAPGGFYIFKLSSGQATSFTRQDLVGKSDIVSSKEVRAQFDFEVGIYCIILTKFEPNAEGKFSLHLFSTHPEFAIGSMKS